MQKLYGGMLDIDLFSVFRISTIFDFAHLLRLFALHFELISKLRTVGEGGGGGGGGKSIAIWQLKEMKVGGGAGDRNFVAGFKET